MVNYGRKAFYRIGLWCNGTAHLYLIESIFVLKLTYSNYKDRWLFKLFSRVKNTYFCTLKTNVFFAVNLHQCHDKYLFSGAI
jgi:hypothetical protein